MLLLMLSMNQDAGKVSGYIYFPATVREAKSFLEACPLTKCRIEDSLSDTKACRCYLQKLVVINELDTLLKGHDPWWNKSQSFI